MIARSIVSFYSISCCSFCNARINSSALDRKRYCASISEIKDSVYSEDGICRMSCLTSKYAIFPLTNFWMDDRYIYQEVLNRFSVIIRAKSTNHSYMWAVVGILRLLASNGGLKKIRCGYLFVSQLNYYTQLAHNPCDFSCAICCCSSMCSVWK